MTIEVKKTKKPNKIGECRDALSAVAVPLSPTPPATAPAQPRPEAGVFTFLITSPHRKHLEGIVKCLPFEIEHWRIFRHRGGWLLVAVLHATTEAVETFDFAGLFAQKGFSFNELIVLASSKAPSLARVSQRWLGNKTNGRQILSVIRKWLRDKVIKTPTAIFVVLLLLTFIGCSAHNAQSEQIKAYNSISPARWVAPATLAPSAPPRCCGSRDKTREAAVGSFR